MGVENGGLDEVRRAVLAACRVATAEIAARPDPPSWDRWEAADLAELRAHGPRYSPSGWFGGGRPVPEKHRVRFLRSIRRLEEAGLVAGTSRGGRLTFLKLTPAGETVAAELAAVDSPASAGGAIDAPDRPKDG